MHRQLNHVWRSRRLVLFADVSRVTAPRRLSTSQRESTRRSAALIYFRLKPPRLLFSPGFVPAYGYNAVEKTELVQNNGPADDKLGQLFAAERSGEESSPRANLFTYVRCSRGRVTFPRAWHFYPGMCRRCSFDSVAIKRRFIRYGFVTVTNADSGGAGNRVTNPTAAGDSPNRAVVRWSTVE